MKLFIILLLGLQVLWADAAPANSPLNGVTTPPVDCEDKAIIIQKQDDQLKELQAKVAELQSKLALLNRNEGEYGDLLTNKSRRMDTLTHKVGEISQIHAGKKSEQVLRT